MCTSIILRNYRLTHVHVRERNKASEQIQSRTVNYRGKTLSCLEHVLHISTHLPPCLRLPVCASLSAPPCLRLPVCASLSVPPCLRLPVCASLSAPPCLCLPVCASLSAGDVCSHCVLDVLHTTRHHLLLGGGHQCVQPLLQVRGTTCTLYVYIQCSCTCTCPVKSIECHGFESHPRQLIFLWKSDCLGCAVSLCLVVCMTLLASFFLPSSSL